MGAYERNTTPNACDAEMNSDGVIGIADLLLVIGSWGTCPTPPTTCPVDFSPAPCGDGDVGIGELLAVIGLWDAQCTAAGWSGPPDEAGMPQDINDCMELAEEAGEIGSEAYERAFEGCYELLCAREIIECD